MKKCWTVVAGSNKIMQSVVLLSHMLILVDISRKGCHGNRLDKTDACIRDISKNPDTFELGSVDPCCFFWFVLPSCTRNCRSPWFYRWTLPMTNKYYRLDRYTRMCFWPQKDVHFVWNFKRPCPVSPATIEFCLGWHTSLLSDTR